MNYLNNTLIIGGCLLIFVGCIREASLLKTLLASLYLVANIITFIFMKG